MPEFLKKGWGESMWQKVTRYRLGNRIRGEDILGGGGEKEVKGM